MKKLLIPLLLIFSLSVQAQQRLVMTTGDTIVVTLKPFVPKPPASTSQKVKNVTVADIQKLSDIKNTYYKITGTLTSRIDLTNVTNCTFDFQNQVTATTGNDLVFSLKGQLHAITIKNLKAKDCLNRMIWVEGWAGKKWNPSDTTTYITSIALDNINITNCRTLFYSDGTPTTSVIKGFTMRNCTINDCPDISSIVQLGSGFGYNIYNNNVDSVNSANDNHNGLWLLKGSGSFYNNTGTNSQGNLARFWLYSHTGVQTVSAYNNSYSNTRKYGMFEVQANDKTILEAFIPANAIIHDNTASNLGYEIPKAGYQIWDGQMIDVYSFGGTLSYFNNTGSNMFGNSKTITDMIHKADDGVINIIVNSGNVYKR